MLLVETAVGWTLFIPCSTVGDGYSVGLWVGDCDGTLVGDTVIDVGDCDGADVGLNDGDSEGDNNVGDFVGIAVAAVGECVGFSVAVDANRVMFRAAE